MLALILQFLIEAEPAVQELVLQLIQVIKDNQAGKATAEEATAAADKVYDLVIAHLANPHADAAATGAIVDAAAIKKFGA